MNKLQQNNQISPFLDPVEKEMIESKQGSKIKDLKRSGVKIFVFTLILKTHLECGQVADEKTIELTIGGLVDNIINYAGGFTLNQIVHAFKLGRIKEFGDWYGLNNNTYEQWVRNYLGYSKRLEANKKQESYIKSLNEPKQLTKQEKDAVMKDASLSAFEIFKDKKYYPDYGNSCFNFLWRKRIIVFTPERIQGFKDQAKKEYIEQGKQDLKTVTSLEMGREIKKELTAIEQGQNDDILLMAAKKIALNTFFRELVETETELKDLF